MAVAAERGEGFLARQPAALDSAFALLEAVAQHGPGVTTRELVDALPMSRATVYRMTKHLVAQEYLVRTPDLTGFALGARVLALGEAARLTGGRDDRPDPADSTDRTDRPGERSGHDTRLS